MSPSIDPIPAAPTLRSEFPTPTHPDRLHVNRSAKAFGSGAVSLIDLPAGALFAKITGTTPGKKAYTSVQTGRDSHLELNSDCKPLAVFQSQVSQFS